MPTIRASTVALDVDTDELIRLACGNGDAATGLCGQPILGSLTFVGVYTRLKIAIMYEPKDLGG